MHRFGGYQANCTFLIDRLDLLRQFGAIAAGETHQREIQRQQRLVASLKTKGDPPALPGRQQFLADFDPNSKAHEDYELVADQLLQFFQVPLKQVENEAAQTANSLP